VSLAVLLSSAVRLAVALWALALWRSLRDWRLAGLATLIGVLALKPIASADVFTVTWTSLLSFDVADAFELLVSMLCVVVVFLFSRTLREGRQARSAWQESESRFHDVAEAASDWFWETDAELRITYLSEDGEQISSAQLADAISQASRRSANGADASDSGAPASEHQPFNKLMHSFMTEDGRQCYTLISGRPVFDDRGAFRGYRGSGTDVTELAEARQALDQSQARLAEVTAGIPGAVYQVVQGPDGGQRYTFVSDGIRALIGLSPEELLLHPTAMMRVVDAEHVAALAASVRHATQTLEPWLHEFRVLTPDGAKWLKGNANAYQRDDGTLVWNGILIDVTERIETEAQLRQAQKMEAVGQLTGGVAHDFNNLLAVVLGNLELIEARLDPDSKLRPFAETGLRAADRGAVLTQRLLAFSRRQALKPEPTNLNRLVEGMLPMLYRALPESIEIKTILAAGLHESLIDAHQLENALLNLAVNARDAMPDGGKLTIETSNAVLDEDNPKLFDEIPAGDYVLLAVSDTGVGMPAEIAERVFEPFFTTKDVGKGSGLGLSMVYGFVKQSGGHVRLYSEAGVGTTVKIFLPSVDTAAWSDDIPAAEEALPSGAGEQVLVVEDDPDVRGLAVLFLKELGYRVLDAEDGPGALTVLAGPEPIDLMLSDVVLPGGLMANQLAEQAIRLRPEMKVIYMSGYAEGALFHHGKLEDGVELLNKPFRRADLARKVRQVLERDQAT